MAEFSLVDPINIAISVVVSLAGGFIRGFSGFGGPAVMGLILVQFFSPITHLPFVVTQTRVTD